MAIKQEIRSLQFLCGGFTTLSSEPTNNFCTSSLRILTLEALAWELREDDREAETDVA
jgi:hypothetical protein